MASTSSVTSIGWTKALYKDFREHFEAAMKAGAGEFTWQGHIFITSYAAYLIEELAIQPLP